MGNRSIERVLDGSDLLTDASTASTNLSARKQFMQPSLDQAPTADIVFSTIDKLREFIDKCHPTVDAVVVANVTRSAFREISKLRDRTGHRWRLLYLNTCHLSIVTLPTYSHEQLHVYLNECLKDGLADMGQGKEEWTMTSSSRYPPDGNGSSGEGDSGGKPFHKRLGHDQWPTIVFEAGFTQSLMSLRTKIRFWFSRSNHQVKIVVIVKAYPGDSAQKKILVEQWLEQLISGSSARRGATTTRMLSAATTLQPVCIQTINVMWSLPGVPFEQATMSQKTDRDSYSVARGPLSLSFESLLLREPNASTEQDVIIPDRDLKNCAIRVWAA
ncbi:hypothetical protein GMORB2_2259 [Geosmithia morbida]|uniref:Uncharacterized protein n=1 Tax=Geosmithia morbida TaxID=1094350 RepID=A0A9P4YT24_9HYPO|nr:uncharacterized protein GMORB2_2259 [Geosmithia morbida]KAF4121297.1 hypothetical protein GMORB2_2259 [Geosmithia morbida]